MLPLLAALAFAPTFRHPERVRFDGQCFTLDGKDVFLYSGAFHYFRCSRAEWRARFRRIKEAGFNAVETYVAWNAAEREKPKGLDDLSGMDLRDLDAWLTMAEREFGLYTIVRPGPYICAEWANGGFPNWLQAFRPQKPLRSLWYRSDDPVFVAWSDRYMKAVAEVVAPHQLFRQPKGRKGTILWQVENEYDHYGVPDAGKRAYLRSLIETSQKSGIEVPIFTCWTAQVRDPQGDPLLGQAFDNPNAYPRQQVEAMVPRLEEQHKAQPWSPKFVTELQGGWFGAIGGQAAEELRGIDATQIGTLTLFCVQHGLTALNYYMLFGGTNFEAMNGMATTPSYDYGAPIREWGGVGDKYRMVQALGTMFARYGADLVRSTEIPTPFPSDAAGVAVAARKGASGATYLFVRNTWKTASEKGRIGPVAYDLPPFGMNVYRYERDPARGEWLVRPFSVPGVKLPPPIRLMRAEVAFPQPIRWRLAPPRATTFDLGIWDTRMVYYRATVPSAGSLTMQNAGGTLTGPVAIGGHATYALYNPGWVNNGAGMKERRGVQSSSVPLEWTDEVDPGPYSAYELDARRPLARLVHSVTADPRVPGDPLVVRTCLRFKRPQATKDVAWELVLDAKGDGLITLNGRLFSRFTEAGPQRSYYLPDSMLGRDNVVEITLLGNRLRAAELRPLPMEYAGGL